MTDEGQKKSLDIDLLSNSCDRSSSEVSSGEVPICRICHCEGTSNEPLITPCQCSGTLSYVHQSCIQQWIKSAGTASCELCKFNFVMRSEAKPLKEWKPLDMNMVERRKVICSVSFHLIAITCVIWSLYVLVDKTKQEIERKSFAWPFWTKIVIVTVGIAGGLVFMYIQCKMYFLLCIRFHRFNRVILIEPLPRESQLLISENVCPETEKSKSNKRSSFIGRLLQDKMHRQAESFSSC